MLFERIAMPEFRYSRLLYYICLLQSIYYAITGIWPLLHIESFIWITGPKYDLWLVKTVGILILVTGIVLFMAARNKRISLEILLLAVGNAIGLTAIDVYYAGIDRISNIYLLDALAEVILVIIWLIAWFKANPKKIPDRK
jgi:hypothetical protein